MASDSEESDLIEAKEPIGPVKGSMDDERLKSAGSRVAFPRQLAVSHAVTEMYDNFGPY